MTDTKNFAAESSHWYKKDGDPIHTVIGANGKERPTTLRDARKQNYLPSVSGIINMAAKPALINWLIDQALMAALTLPRIEGESLDAFMARAKIDSKEQSKKAAEAGSALHASIERGFLARPIDPAHEQHFKNVCAALDSIGIDVANASTERSFASKLGYGGKLDLSGPNFVVDYKSKPTIEDGKDYAYDEHVMQLSAYAEGLEIPQPRLINLFVGIQDAKVAIKEWTPEEGKKGFAMFTSLLGYWQAKNQYIPQ